MTADVDTTLRGPAAYELAKSALLAMEEAGVWPTPLNFELWSHFVADPEGDHLLVLARGVEGYHALASAITEANLVGDEKGRPAYDLDDLVDRGRGRWTILTGCRKGWARREGIAGLRRLVDLFGADSVVAELTDHGGPGDGPANDALAGWAAMLGLPVVATGNVHAARFVDTRLAQAFAAVRARRSLAELDGWLAPPAYLRSGAEMAHRFARWPGAVARSVEIADDWNAAALSDALAALPGIDFAAADHGGATVWRRSAPEAPRLPGGRR